ncbi:MAG TPA: erythromycin esterase family protein [Polyangiaceae bacterium]|nr:erythromycin esterase family protein [Polyangiaceae bacterium]
MARAIVRIPYSSEPDARRAEELAEALQPLARPLSSDDALEPLVERVGGARYVLLGGAAPGASELLTWRAHLTRRLVEAKGFSIVALEGDAGVLERVGRYVRGAAGEPSARKAFGPRPPWPGWAWANEELAELAEWLREHNAARPAAEARVGLDSLDWDTCAWHMLERLERLIARQGEGAKAVIWGHNAQVGDARYAGREGGEPSLGQLMREQHGAEGVLLVGSSAYAGSVLAAAKWGAPPAPRALAPGRPGSLEDALHRLGEGTDLLLLFGAHVPEGPLLAPRGHRALGFVYDPSREGPDAYVPTVLPRRYDALFFVDRASPSRPCAPAPGAQPRPARRPLEAAPGRRF